MRRLSFVLALLWCKAVQAAPPPVLAEAVIPDPGAFLEATAAYLDAVRPGGGKQWAAFKPFLASKGMDMSRPMWVVAFDPAADALPVIVIFHAREGMAATALGTKVVVRRLGELSVTGPAALLDSMPESRLTAMAARPVPPRVTARIDLPRVLAMVNKKDPYLAQMPEVFWKALGEVRELVAELDFATANVEIVMSLAGPAGSTIGQVGAALRPGDFGLATTVKDAPWVMAGTIAVESLGRLFEPTFDTKEKRSVWRKLAPLLTGSFALGVWPPSRHALVIGTTDAKRALALLEDEQLRSTGTFQRVQGAVKEGGVVADEVTYTPAQPAAAGVLVIPFSLTAAVGQTVVSAGAATSPEARATFKAVIAASRAATAVPKPMVDARAGKASMAAYLDFGALSGTPAPPFVVSAIGIRDGVQLRMSVPAALLRQLAPRL